MGRHCPWCCEPLRGSAAGACPHCGRPLEDANGRELRPIDLRYDQVEAAQWQRYRTLQLYGIPLVVLISLVLPVLHGAVAVAAPLLAVVHLMVVRLAVVGDARRLLHGSRRLFNRWLARFAFLWLGVPGYALAAIPLAGALIGAGTFAGLNAAVYGYSRWSLRREQLRQPLAAWERVLLAVLAVATVLLLVLIVGVAVLVGWSVAALLRWLGAD